MPSRISSPAMRPVASKRRIANAPAQPLLLICPEGGPCAALSNTTFEPAGQVAQEELADAYRAQGGRCVACGRLVLPSGVRPVRTVV
jgi:delta 1-pyrroline-5-carboxylate dehydrogenase